MSEKHYVNHPREDYRDISGPWSKEYQSWAGDDMRAKLTMFPYGCYQAPSPVFVHFEVVQVIEKIMQNETNS